MEVKYLHESLSTGIRGFITIHMDDVRKIPDRILNMLAIRADADRMGIIKCGSAVIQFDYQISKDTGLYKLYNTNIHEKIAEQKAREAMENLIAE